MDVWRCILWQYYHGTANLCETNCTHVSKCRRKSLNQQSPALVWAAIQFDDVTLIIESTVSFYTNLSAQDLEGFYP